MILLSVLLLITISTTTFFFFQTQKLAKQLANLQGQPTPTPVASTEPSPTEIPATGETNSATKILSYQLPPGWQIINDKDNIFSIGFDPNKYNPNLYNSRVDLNSKKCCSSIFLKILPYEGSSRFSFIVKNSGAVKTSSTTEQEYLINGKSSLILYNVDASGSNTVGTITLDQNRALLIESQTSSKALIDQILSTFRFLKWSAVAVSELFLVVIP